MLESQGRNTAPALTIAALSLVAADGDAMILMMPADHMIKGVEQFQQAIRIASRFVANDFLFTFGISPKNELAGATIPIVSPRLMWAGLAKEIFFIYFYGFYHL